MQIHAKGLALFTAAILFVASALAQAPVTLEAPSPSPRPDPADAKAAVAPLVYRSAFQGYRPHSEVEAGAWKEANTTVGRIGGWRVYAREANPSDAAASAPAVPKPTADHAGHRHH